MPAPNTMDFYFQNDKIDLMKKFFLIFILFLFFFTPFLVESVGLGQPCDGAPCDPGLECYCGKCRKACPPGEFCIRNPLCAQSIEELIDSIITFIFYLAIAIAPLMWIIAGFILLTSAGNPEKVNQAKKIALYTAIGFFLVMLAKALVAVVRRVIS